MVVLSSSEVPQAMNKDLPRHPAVLVQHPLSIAMKEKIDVQDYDKLSTSDQDDLLLLAFVVSW